MPELPEVETIVRRLQSVLPGKRVLEVEAVHPKSLQGDASKILEATITAVSRRAKVIRIDLDIPYSLLIHLKMTGQLIYTDGQTRVGGGHPTADWTSELPSKHTRVVFDLGEGAQLFFNDQRIFGWIKVLSSDQADQELSKLAPDVHAGVVSALDLYQKLQHTRRPIKLAILDGSVVSGVGNIYVCDALHAAKINPQKPSNSLTLVEAEKLLDACIQVIEKGIELGGATIDHFRHIDGFSGKYQDVRRVYAREGEPCIVCSTAIEKFSLAGRGTYWCPECQP